jgi:hypothetical protein
MTMILPKSQIQSTLAALGYPTKQSSQDSVTESPAITFRIDDNTPEYDLNNEIAAQNIVATVDIWADDSVAASNILTQVEKAMRGINYQMTYSADVQRPTGALFHIQCRFSALAV